MSKAKTVSKKTKRWKLFDGVGFQPEAATHYAEYQPARHCVVLVQSMHHGTDVYGPFINEDAAHKWIREEAEGEVWQRFNRSIVPGLSCHVVDMEVPTARKGYD